MEISHGVERLQRAHLLQGLTPSARNLLGASWVPVRSSSDFDVGWYEQVKLLRKTKTIENLLMDGMECLADPFVMMRPWDLHANGAGSRDSHSVPRII